MNNIQQECGSAALSSGAGCELAPTESRGPAKTEAGSGPSFVRWLSGRSVQGWLRFGPDLAATCLDFRQACVAGDGPTRLGARSGPDFGQTLSASSVQKVAPIGARAMPGPKLAWIGATFGRPWQ